MTLQNDDEETVYLDELTFANTMQVDALSQLLIKKGLMTEQEFFDKSRQVQIQYQDQGVKS